MKPKYNIVFLMIRLFIVLQNAHKIHYTFYCLIWKKLIRIKKLYFFNNFSLENILF